MTIAKKALSLFAFILILFILTIPAQAEEGVAIEIIPPIILETAKIQDGSQNRILIKGLIKPNNEVLIYINGVYSGLANISQGDNNFSLFYYLSPVIKDADNNEVLAIARDQKFHVLSSPVQIVVNSVIEKTFLTQPSPKEIISSTNNTVSAPILKTPKQKNCENKPYISGFSKNQTIVKLFIDNKLFTSILATSKVSETAFFSYTPNVSLERGEHFVYATAEDNKGRVSPKSNYLFFCVSSQQIMSTSTSENKEVNIGSSSVNEVGNGKIEDANSVFQKTNSQDQTNKKANDKSNNKVNLFLFTIFVFIIIIWIIIVNKELLEENKNPIIKPK